jgi:signal transduction histidine kinase
MALPVAWAVFLTVLIAFPTGRMYDTHGEKPNVASEITSVLFLRVPIMVMFGIVVRTAAAQNEERRRLLDTLAAAERREGILEERQRLAREIHDTLAQGFAAIVMHLEQADVAASMPSESVRPHLDFARSIARENLEEARRMLTALRPEVLDQEGGLAAAIHRVCSEWSKRSEIPCAVNVTGDVLMLHSEVEVMLLRGTQELLANVRKHARAKHVTVTLSYITDVVALDVRDDGAGFEPNASTATGGFGLRGLRERTAQLGGTVEVESTPGEGTTVSVTIPAFRTETYPVPVESLGSPASGLH